MKDVRNSIVHEYIEDDLKEVFDEVLEYTDLLIKIIKDTIMYMENTKI